MGEDQRQHLELSRTLAQRFNHRYGQTFTCPAAVHPGRGGQDLRPAGPDGQDEQVVVLAAGHRRRARRPGGDPQEDRPGGHRRGSEVRADPEAKPGVTNLLRIYSALAEEPVARPGGQVPGRGLRGFKKDLAERVVATFAPIKEKTERILADEAALDRILADGAARAHRVAGYQTMAAVRDHMGLLKPAG